MKKRPGHPTPTEVVFDSKPLLLRHWIVLLGIVIFLTAAFCLYLSAGNEIALESQHLDELKNRPFDDDVELLAQVRSPEFRKSDLVILGTSSIREGLLPDSELEKGFLQLTRHPIRITTLASASQTFLDAIYILDQADIRPGQLFIIHTTPSAFARTLTYAELAEGGFIQDPSTFADRYRQLLPDYDAYTDSHPPIWIASKIFRAWVYRNIYNRIDYWSDINIYNLPEDPRYRLEGQPLGDSTIHMKHRDRVHGVLRSGFEQNREITSRTLITLIDHIESRGAHVIVAESPYMTADPAFTFGEWWIPYQAGVQRIVHDKKLTWVDLNQSLALPPSLFYDTRHLGPEGRARWSAGMIQWLATHYYESERENVQ